MGVFLVAYDIPDDRRRKKVAQALSRIGRRVQYSVFLVRRGTPQEVARLLSVLIEPAEDDVRIHPLCAACEGKALLMGRAPESLLPEGFSVI